MSRDQKIEALTAALVSQEGLISGGFRHCSPLAIPEDDDDDFGREFPSQEECMKIIVDRILDAYQDALKGGL